SDGCRGARLAAHGFCDLVVQAKPSDGGMKTATLRVSSLFGDEVKATLTVLATYGDLPVNLSPSPADFGDVPVGDTRTKTFEFRNFGGTPVTVAAVTL